VRSLSCSLLGGLHSGAEIFCLSIIFLAQSCYVGLFRYWAVCLDDVDSFWAGRARAALNDKDAGPRVLVKDGVDVRGSTGWKPPHDSSFVRRHRVATSYYQINIAQ
jgi:hypothetical protein